MVVLAQNAIVMTDGIQCRLGRSPGRQAGRQPANDHYGALLSPMIDCRSVIECWPLIHTSPCAKVIIYGRNHLIAVCGLC